MPLKPKELCEIHLEIPPEDLIPEDPDAGRAKKIKPGPVTLRFYQILNRTEKMQGPELIELARRVSQGKCADKNVVEALLRNQHLIPQSLIGRVPFFANTVTRISGANYFIGIAFNHEIQAWEKGWLWAGLSGMYIVHYNCNFVSVEVSK